MIPVRRTLSVVALALALLSAPEARAADDTAIGTFGWGLSAGLCTLVYTPIKVAYAATAIPLGGLVWIFSAGNVESATRVIVSATTGDFVVTPEHLQGSRTLNFIGTW